VLLTRLALADFRNFRAAEIVLGPGLTLIEGRNGQGKSNLLEAAFVFGCLRPLRARSMADLVRAGAGGFRLQGAVEDQARPFAIAGDGARRFLFAGEAPTTAGRWTPRTLAPVAFLPEDVSLAAEAGEARRRYLDGLAAAMAPGHAAALAVARRTVAQRAGALAGGQGAELWEGPLAGAYAAVAAGRRAAATALQEVLPALAEEFGEGEKAAVRYRPSVAALAEPLDDAAAAQAVLAVLAGMRAREAAAGLCLVGPHRDEVQFLVAEQDVRRHASRGQQRTLAVALRAAEVEMVRRHGGADPLLLVDDVLPELDAARQRRVLARALAAPQALLASAERSPALAAGHAARRYRVEAGQVTREA
jgi:DNA replication and repair protein RecF